MPNERLILSNAQTSSTDGSATFRLGPVELGLVWKGAVQVPNAPAGALFVATVLNANWGQWAGPTNFGPVQMYGSETLQVVATGLTPSTNYVLTFFGVYMPASEAEPIPPAAPISTVSVETSTLLVNAKVMAAPGGTINFKPPSLTRRLTIIVDATSLTGTPELDLLGDTSKVPYFAQVLVPGASQNQPYYAAIEPNVDTTYTLSYSAGGGGSAKIWVLASLTNPLVVAEQFSPLFVVPALPTYQSQRGLAFNVSGGPTGPFNTFLTTTPSAGANKGIIGAPGAGNSIYLQQLTVSAFNSAAGSAAECLFHSSAGPVIASADINDRNNCLQLTFPGGLEIGTNLALQADVALVTYATIRVCASYAIGPTI